MNTRKSPERAAEAARSALAESATLLESQFSRHYDLKKVDRLTEADLSLLWSFAAAIRICHEAGQRAMYSVDELGTAQMLAVGQAKRFKSLVEPLSPDGLARLVANKEQSLEKSQAMRRAALPLAATLVTSLHETVTSINSQADLSKALLAKGISGPNYLRACANEAKEALLFLPA